MLSKLCRNRSLAPGTSLDGLKIFKSVEAPKIQSSYPEWIKELANPPLIVVNLQESFDSNPDNQRQIVRKYRKQIIKKQNLES